MKMYWSDIRTVLRSSLRALRKGEFLLSIGAHKYYLHILYLFVLAWLVIFLNLQIDKTLHQVEANKKTLRTLEITATEKEAELVRLHSASTAQQQLQRMGSDVTLPVTPPTKIGNR